MDIRNNRIYKYVKNDELNETFFVFYKKDDKYYIDIGCCYEYGDYDHGRFYFFNYNFEITNNIELELEPDIYNSLIKELNSMDSIFGSCIFDYHILNEDEYIEDYENIKIEDNRIFWYKTDKDIFFIDDDTKIKFINAFIKLNF